MFLKILSNPIYIVLILKYPFEKQLYGLLCFKCRRPRTTSQVFIDSESETEDEIEHP